MVFVTYFAFAGNADSNDIYKYPIEADDNVVECYGAMMGDLSNHFNPSVSRTPNGDINVDFNLLSISDYKPNPDEYARIKIKFDNGAVIGFRSTCYAVLDESIRMRITLKNARLDQLSLLATHDIVSWTMNGWTIPVNSPTAGIFAAMFRELDVKDSNGQRPDMCEAEPIMPTAFRYHLCMAVRPADASSDAHLMLLNADQWRRLKDKDKYERQGLLIHYDEDKCFLVDYYDQYDRCGYPDWYTAAEMFGDRLPTALMGAILSQTTELRDVANAFGGDNYGNYYWTSTICDDSDGSEAYVFCPAIPDAPIDRQKMTEPTNAGVLLVDIPFEEIYEYYLSDTLQ